MEPTSHPSFKGSLKGPAGLVAAIGAVGVLLIALPVYRWFLPDQRGHRIGGRRNSFPMAQAQADPGKRPHEQKTLGTGVNFVNLTPHLQLCTQTLQTDLCVFSHGS